MKRKHVKNDNDRAMEALRKTWAHFYTSKEHKGYNCTAVFRITSKGKIAIARSFCSPMDDFDQEKGLDKARSRMRAFLAMHEANPKMVEHRTRYSSQGSYQQSDQRSFTLFEVLDANRTDLITRSEGEFIQKNIAPKLSLIKKQGGSQKVAKMIQANRPAKKVPGKKAVH